MQICIGVTDGKRNKVKKEAGIYLEFLLDGPKAHPTKIPWALTLAGGLGAARLPVGSRDNALVRGPGELCSGALLPGRN